MIKEIVYWSQATVIVAFTGSYHHQMANTTNSIGSSTLTFITASDGYHAHHTPS